MKKVCFFNIATLVLTVYFPQVITQLPYHHDWKLAYQTTLGLRVHWFGRWHTNSQWAVPPSRLARSMISFFFVEKNSCWTVINGKRIVSNTGDLLVTVGGDEFWCGHDDPTRPHVGLSACLALETGSIPNTLAQFKFKRLYSWSNPAEFTMEFDRVLRAFASVSPYRDMEISGALLSWLSYLMCRMAPPLDSSYADGREAVDKVLAAQTWANSRLKESITLRQWASAVNLHPVYFGRIFRRESGMRPMEWLNNRRLQMASQYLSSTGKRVSEIAEMSGFSDHFYFCRVFRKHYALSPLQFRKSRFR